MGSFAIGGGGAVHLDADEVGLLARPIAEKELQLARLRSRDTRADAHGSPRAGRDQALVEDESFVRLRRGGENHQDGQHRGAS